MKAEDVKNKRGRATIKDVAKLAGVSISTASMAINGKDRVSEETRKAILDAVKELSYKPNNSARNLRVSKTKVIGLLIPDILNSYYSEIIEYVRKEMESHGYFLILGISGNKIANEEKYISEFISRGVDGVICVPQLIYVNDTTYLNQLDIYKIPYIFLSANYEQNNAPYVMCDLQRGSYELTDYLLSKGLKKILLMVGDKKVDKLYINGFVEAFRKHGLSPNQSAIYESSYIFDEIQSVAEDMIDQQPQAIISISDLMACAILQVARRRKIKVPTELSIAGYDDVIYSTINQIPITTVKQPIKEMCASTVKNLLNMINHEEIPQSLMLEPKLVIRDTTL